MRRKDREVTELSQIDDIIRQCRVCRIGMRDKEDVYIIPMNFGYSFADGRLSLFFHCAHEGRKINILRENNRVGFEMDCGHNLVEAETACGYGFKYASVIGTGTVRFADSPGEKIEALASIMKQQAGKEFEIGEEAASSVTVFIVEADTYSCKKN